MWVIARDRLSNALSRFHLFPKQLSLETKRPTTMASAAKPVQQITLEKRVKALLQELQDKIYDFTFELPPPATVKSRSTSNPSHR